jgi:hypothetical protein
MADEKKRKPFIVDPFLYDEYDDADYGFDVVFGEEEVY